ncbi:MAG: 50S ribosome-binding GTPase [Anaerohalosphaeraceae bacterium]|nr:50S ribosome-binding GTPase [Anaerohalosphaeraceae bacterium]
MLSAKSQTVAAVVTGKAVAAVSVIHLTGPAAKEILGQIFSRGGSKSSSFEVGEILHGHIIDADRIIDDCLIGCEGDEQFGINCHGNPLIVEDILELLKSKGVQIIEPDELLMLLAQSKDDSDLISAEVEIAAIGTVTIVGAKIIKHQLKMGLRQTGRWWLENLESMDIDDVAAGAEKIIADSAIASLIINGAKAVLTGKPNSGKSTLFNRLCGRQKAIVTDIAGTTRDWLSAKIKLKTITVELFDTAGIEKSLVAANEVDAQSQQRAKELSCDCDIILNVIAPGETSVDRLCGSADKKILFVLNKSDLGKCKAAGSFEDTVSVSAKDGHGIDKLVSAIEVVLGVADYDFKATVCFTERQMKLMAKIAVARSKKEIRQFITELLTG